MHQSVCVSICECILQREKKAKMDTGTVKLEHLNTHMFFLIFSFIKLVHHYVVLHLYGIASS